jgi:aminoglycoside phosphotransferase (APT) family kinase protein
MTVDVDWRRICCVNSSSEQTCFVTIMHEGQSDISVRTVVRLVAEQFPQWKNVAVTPVESHGTVNSLFRLGDGLVLRFRLFPIDDPKWLHELATAREMLATLANRVAVRIPVPLVTGRPGDGYPGFWFVSEWIPGETAVPSRVGDLNVFASELAHLVSSLQTVPTSGRSWNGVTRGGPLSDFDEQVRECIARSAQFVDASRIEAVWSECLAVSRGGRDDVWLHADLMPGNLLVREGHLVAVIDWEMVGVGDPAVDLMPAWNFLPSEPRKTFREILAPDVETWIRGRGWALCQAIIALPYYAETNRAMATTALHTLNAIIS